MQVAGLGMLEQWPAQTVSLEGAQIAAIEGLGKVPTTVTCCDMNFCCAVKRVLSEKIQNEHAGGVVRGNTPVTYICAPNWGREGNFSNIQYSKMLRYRMRMPVAW